MPSFDDQAEYTGTLLHSSSYTNGSAFRNKRALVVGFGNSGAEIALDLWENGAEVTLAVRSPVQILPRWKSGLDTTRSLTPLRSHRDPTEIPPRSHRDPTEIPPRS